MLSENSKESESVLSENPVEIKEGHDASLSESTEVKCTGPNESQQENDSKFPPDTRTGNGVKAAEEKEGGDGIISKEDQDMDNGQIEQSGNMELERSQEEISKDGQDDHDDAVGNDQKVKSGAEATEEIRCGEDTDNVSSNTEVDDETQRDDNSFRAELENKISEIESKIKLLEDASETNKEKISFSESGISKIEQHLKIERYNSRYWMEGAELKKTPLVKEHSAHQCQMLPWFVKFSLLFTCALNYADTFTDLVTTVDMFRSHKYVLGCLSLLVMVLVAIWIPFHTRSLTEEEEGKKSKWKFSWRTVVATLTLSSTQYFIFKNFLLPHREGKFDRRKCLGYHNERCRTDKCNNLRHKIRQLQEAVILEKMVENLPQFILQIINIAPEYLSKGTDIGGFWDYWKLASLFLTSFSLARACVKFDFVRLDLNPRLFSFYSISSGWKALYPQKYLLALIHTTMIIGRGLAVIFLAILVNHDFLSETKPKMCTLPETWADIRSPAENQVHCHFETKVAWLLFLYVTAFYAGVTLITLYIVPSYVYKHSIKHTLKGIKSVGAKVGYVLAFVGNLWWIYILNFVLQQRHYMFDVTNHLPNIGGAKFVIKMLPSILHSIGTVTFTVLFHSMQGSFNNVEIRITPFQLAVFGLVVEAVHLVALLFLIYKADPSHVHTLSNEKIVEYLIRKGKVGEEVDVSCSRKTKDILKEVVGSEEEGSCDIYKEDIRDDIIALNRKLPPSTRMSGLAEFHRTFAEAIKRYSGVHKDQEEYVALQQVEQAVEGDVAADDGADAAGDVIVEISRGEDAKVKEQVSVSGDEDSPAV